MRATSSRSSPSSSRSRLDSSTIANGSTNSVWPELLVSWTMPGTALRALARTATTGRPPRSVTKSSCRCGWRVGIRRERAQPVAGAAPRGRELGAQRLELGRGGVLDARRIELERALEPVGDDRERLGDLRRRGAASSGTVSARSAEVPAHAERRARRLGDRDEPLGAERPAAAGVLGVGAHVVRARHPRRPVLDEHQRLGAQRLARARPRRRPATAAAPRRARGWPRRTCGSPAARESRQARARRARDRPSRRRIGRGAGITGAGIASPRSLCRSRVGGAARHPDSAGARRHSPAPDLARRSPLRREVPAGRTSACARRSADPSDITSRRAGLEPTAADSQPRRMTHRGGPRMAAAKLAARRVRHLAVLGGCDSVAAGCGRLGTRTRPWRPSSSMTARVSASCGDLRAVDAKSAFSRRVPLGRARGMRFRGREGCGRTAHADVPSIEPISRSRVRRAAATARARGCQVALAASATWPSLGIVLEYRPWLSHWA